MSTRTRTLAGALALALSAGALSACRSGEVAAPESSAVRVFDPESEPAVTIAPIDFSRRDVTTAPDLEASFDRLLREHVSLTMGVTRTVFDRTPDRDALISALARNSEDLRQLFGVAYGPDAARSFAQLWDHHNQFFVDYAQARAGGSPDRARRALEGLARFESDFLAFADDVTGGRASPLGFDRFVKNHVGQVNAHIDALARNDGRQAVNHQVAALRSSSSVAAGWATVISSHQPDAFPGTLDDPAVAARREVRRQSSTEVGLLIDAVFAKRFHPGVADHLVAAADAARRADTAVPSVDALLTPGIVADSSALSVVNSSLLAMGTALSQGDMQAAVAAARDAVRAAALG